MNDNFQPGALAKLKSARLVKHSVESGKYLVIQAYFV